MKRLFGRFALVGLVLIGGYGTYIANNWAATHHIRSHENVLSRLEQSLLACGRQEDSLPYWACIDNAWSVDKASRDALLADCGIRLDGDFTVSTGFPPSYSPHAGIPHGYRVPISFFLSECRGRTTWYAKSVKTVENASEQSPEVSPDGIHPMRKRRFRIPRPCRAPSNQCA